MKRRLVTVLIALTGFAVVAPMAPATADTPSCVSRSEFRKVRQNMSKAKVHRIFDVDGRREAISHSGAYHAQVRSYKGCGQGSYVSVAFDKAGANPWKLSAKSASWG
ncbi:hypothetical protein [Nocardioides euryhalodurans]|uniref:Uncharacterized protein n=1 Tax=Nocardioides euryhalodurans TaxID=2518370 RepID=A0A4P7GHM0_9ACTN|nr:hypothetical protein [Nocardioides euryhalodurans]QBR91400.1 hypothetical protein EXE57_03290 [Nocardioides euryhalodurans]